MEEHPPAVALIRAIAATRTVVSVAVPPSRANDKVDGTARLTD